MKSRIFVIIGILTLVPISVLVTSDNAYALCMPNSDWPDRPCYGCIGCYPGLEQEKLDWKSINSDVIILSQSVKESLLIRYQDVPEVIAFYAKYNNAQVSIRDDHISYFAGNEDGFLMRMNVFFDKNHTLDHMDLHCYFQKVHQYEVSQEDIISKLEKYDC